MSKSLEDLGYRKLGYEYPCRYQGHGNVIEFSDSSVTVSSFPFSSETKLSIDELKAILMFAEDYCLRKE